MDANKLLLFAGGALGLITAAVVFSVTSGDDSGFGRPTQAPGASFGASSIKGATGDPIVCGGGEILSSWSEGEDTFQVTGTLEGVSAGALRVQAPTGMVRLSLDAHPTVEGEYWGGEAIHATGNIADDGTLLVTSVRQACPHALVREIPAALPSPTPDAPPPVEFVTPSKPQAHGESHKPLHVTLGGDDDEKDEKPEKHESNAGGHEKARDDEARDDRDGGDDD
ncbi:MAG: hypothetical protein WD904_10540 [Dehalococcoidia bacterium]